MQVKLFTEEVFSSFYRCLNPYMFFPLISRAKGRFCDPLSNDSSNHFINIDRIWDFFRLRGGFFLSRG